MILFPAVLAGGHLLIAVVDKVPQLNYEPICRELESGKVGIKDSFEICVKDEAIAREKLAREWDGFSAADRAGCVRGATMDRTASYVEVLTCLELARDAHKLRQKPDAVMGALAPIARPETTGPAVESRSTTSPPRERAAAPVRRDRPRPDPVSLAPPEAPPEPANAPVFCLPGLAALIPACNDSRR